jgi:sortase A
MIAIPPQLNRETSFVLICAVILVNIAGFLSLHAALVLTGSISYQAQKKEMTMPVRVRIPAINVDAPIVNVGLRRDKTMDIPSTVDEVGWFEPGFVPGEAGNAVFAGHLDTISGRPAVFWDLRRLKNGDIVEVEHEDGSVRRFRVRDRATYPMDDAPMEKIFGSATGSHLNLVTCNGQWQDALQTYTRRLVVYTDEISDSISD